MTSTDLPEKDAYLAVTTQKSIVDDPSADKALQFLAEHAGKFEELTPAEEKWAIRKTDLILLPTLFFTATMGAVDKVSLSTAAIFGFKTDNNLVGQQYSWLGVRSFPVAL
ncbi:hypothetical protein KL928_005137 [Ogataea angusta]|uniref:Uncharacterized protein n=1 Tax=Pichia angusta TaxID=870730 RepID=A0AAN6DDT2_PICAN|nr:uncharacterized protein KL928_005137 [Ogataea angusta]KAG7816171.1 hypothetical protein KL928_005137 [Ogataea angusta]